MFYHFLVKSDTCNENKNSNTSLTKNKKREIASIKTEGMCFGKKRIQNYILLNFYL